MSKTIRVFTQPSCGPCVAVKSWLKRHGGDFTVVDITKSPEDAEAIKALGYTKTPVLIVSNGDAETDLHWAGFNEEFMKKYCGKDAA